MKVLLLIMFHSLCIVLSLDMPSKNTSDVRRQLPFIGISQALQSVRQLRFNPDVQCHGAFRCSHTGNVANARTPACTHLRAMVTDCMRIGCSYAANGCRRGVFHGYRTDGQDRCSAGLAD
jgi:hypothetical protein